MSNKITLATIQFRADTKGVNPALDAMRQSAKDAHDEMDRMQEALDKGIKKMKNANGVEFDVADRLKAATKEARSFDQAVRELVKGATALETVVQNIRLGEIEKSSRAELKGAINAAEARKRSVRETDPEDLQQQRELNQVIEESRKQLNNLDRDTQKVIETLDKGGVIAQATLDKEIKGLKEILTLIPKGTDEWNKYNQQLTQMEAHVANIRRQEREAAVSLLDSKNFGRYSEEEIRTAITNARELLATYKTASPEAKALADNIVRADQYLKEHGIEAARQTAREKEQLQLEQELAKTMNKRLRDLKNLSADALVETRKYWEAQKNGAAEGTTEFNKAEAALKKIDGYQRNARRTELGNILGDPSKFGVSEVKAAVQEAEKLRDSVQKGIPVWFQYNKMVKQGREYLDRLTKSEAADHISQQMNNLSSLSASGLQEVKKYWETMVAGAEKGSDELAEYEQHLKSIAFEEQARVREKGREAFAFFQREDYRRTNAADTEEQRKALVAYRDSLPADDTDHIEGINALLEKQAQFVKEAAGEWMSLEKAMELAKTAGTDGFAGSAKDIQLATQSLERQRDTIIATIREKRNLGQVTKTEEDQLADLTKKLRSLKFEQDNVNMSQEKMRTLIETPANAVNLDELRAAIKRADGQLRQMQDSLGQNSAEYKRFAEQVRQAKNVMKEMEGQAKASATAWEKAFNRLKTYVVMYMGFNEVWHKITGTARDLMDLSDRMGEVRKTTGFTADEVGRLSENLKKMDVRTSLTSLMEISASAGQLGLKTLEDVQGFTEAANKLMIALPEMGREAATEMMRVAIATGEVDKIRKQLQEGTIEGSSATAVAMEKIASTIHRLRATSASTAPEITDFVKRVGAVGAQSGITIDQVAALGSTVSSLGMRVEMSATALSRMIPAIRNNAFEIAKSIGVTPETVRELFDAGRGMEVILMILQRMKDANMDADSIESMMGMGGMRDIMKDLNQQGARAGIVFAGLSQNVDELRRQLGVANLAYEENIAIQQEFNRMNETTAAKWERLKNQIEELFVGDQAQRYLGSLIDGLRGLVDLLTGPLKGSILILGTLIGLLKIGLGAGLVTAVIKVIDVFKNWRIAIELTTMKLHAMKAAQWGNLFTAIAGAVLMLVLHFRQLGSVMTGVAKAIATLEAELRKEVKAVNELFHAVAKSNVELENKRKKLEEVKKAGKDATDAENQLKKTNAEHTATIREINSKYGQYLGYMLSETSSAQQLAKARELINAKLRETITLKQREAALGNIEQEYGGKVNKRATAMEQTLQTFYGSDYDTSARVSIAITEAAEKYAKDSKGFQDAVKKILAQNKIQGDVADEYMGTFEGYRSAVEEYMKQEDVVNRRFEARTNVARKESREKAVAALNAIKGDWQKLVDDYQKAEGEEKERLAAEVYKQQRNYANAYANNASYFENDNRKAVFDKDINNMKTYEKGLRSVAGEAIRTIDAMERAESKITGIDYTNGGESGNNPWGGKPDAESTDWKNMTAEQLVNRREQMNKFVNSLQTDTDVKAVLNEDKALKKAIEAGMSSDMRTVIEWYNTERLKIQDELHARHLTNTGDWLDPKKQRAARKQWHDEIDAYLHELDAYYTERKTRIEQARNDEEITEGEAWRRIIQNDNEWQTRRGKLQKIYADKSGEVTQEEMDAIYRIISERTGDSVEFVRGMVAKTNKFAKDIAKSSEQGAATAHEWWSGMDVDAERSFLKAAQAIGKQMKFIEETLAKERPYDGITKNLQDNLDKMGVLAAKYRRENEELARQDKGPKYSNEQITAQSFDEMAFYLRQAADAYSIDVDELLRRMVKEGMTATAEEISKSDMLKQAVMGQLRKTYQEVQDAIKKEASQIKKDVEIIWNDDARGIGGMSMKATFDKALAQLGMQQDSVSRANSLIGAGAASDNVASRLAMKQIEVQMRMQKAQYDMYRVQANQRMAALKVEAEEHRRLAKQMEKENHLAESKRELLMATNAERDAENVRLSLGLTLAEETKKEEQQKAELLKIQEESQNRLYTSLRSWADLLTSSLQGVMEASHAGDAEYYNERAKLNLTGQGGPGAGTYVVIDNAGTSDATAHYEYLDERQALERQHEIEIQNAQAEAWRKLMDDINMKMSEQITDWMNAALQNQSIDANTDATLANTEALIGLSGAIAGSSNGTTAYGTGGAGLTGSTGGAVVQNEALSPAEVQEWTDALGTEPWLVWEQAGVQAMQGVQKATEDTGKKMAASTQSTFAKMTQAANLYGIAYQTMSNDNLSASQKFQMFALQAAGNAAIAMLTTDMASVSAKHTMQLPGILGKLLGEMPYPAAIATFAAVTALLGGLMGLAMSKVAKSKGEIAQATGASVGAGRLTTGMLTYASGNVNELTDPASLTPGRQYNVDGADGKTYRARYMGKGAKTHITNGPEFHLVGEAGREAIIDAKTTRLLQMNETGIWRDIQTLYNGGSIAGVALRRRRGVRAYAEGNVGEFEEMGGDIVVANGTGGMSAEMLASLQASIDRQSDLLENALVNGIKAVNKWTGSDGIPAMYNKMQKEAQRHGEKYL